VALIGSAEAEAILGISRNTLTRRAEAGEVPSVGRIGRSRAFVYDRAVIEALAAQQTQAAAS